MCPVTPLPAARPAFPAVPRPCLGDSLPLHIQHRVGIAASQRDDVILSIAGTGAACLAGGRARMRADAGTIEMFAPSPGSIAPAHRVSYSTID